MERRSNYGPTLPLTSGPDSGPARERKIRKASRPSGCSIASLFYLLLGFQIAWIFIGLTQRGSSWAELRQIEKRLGDRIEQVSKKTDETIEDANLKTLSGSKNGTRIPVSDFVWNLADDTPRSGRDKTSSKSAAIEFNFDPANVGEPNCNQSKSDRQNGTLAWNPKANRFLLAVCSGGQLSNRLACIRQNMLDAAILNRTLVLPTTGIDYNYEELLDLSAPDVCFGPNRMISLKEYIAAIDTRVRVGRFICHVHTYQTEDICQQIVNTYASALNITFAKIEVAKRRTPGPWFKYPSSDLIKKFNSDHHMLAFGNMFGVGGRELRFEGKAPLIVSGNCTGFLQPSKAIQETATGFLNSYLGTMFLGIHLRRGDFFQHCLKGHGKLRKNPCFHPISQLAGCLAKKAKQYPIMTTIFLATNAEDLELDMLRKGLEARGVRTPVMRVPEMGTQPWAEPLFKQGLGTHKDVISLVDKTVCAMSPLFLGTWGSTFTHDIFRLRDWWRHGSSCDGYMCDIKDPADVLPMAESEAP